VNFSGSAELLDRQLGDQLDGHRGDVRVVEVPGQTYCA
jgi:hypothetical protein